MDIQTLRKVIELYLRGFGYQEISKRTCIARSTVQDTVNRWREGQTGCGKIEAVHRLCCEYE
ncbi:MAG: helix-turn-helix domain-containing protein [Cuniculiplasma divulgatum]|nr:MAG: helix-turn-helix domain-containing protein [Cuniculiplasma divulgatum]